MKILFFAIILSFWGTSTFSETQHEKTTGTYQNPVILGDFPDPTVIRVDNKYYAAGTSSDFAPNYPLYESIDLVNWKQIGFIFNQLPEWTSRNFWAPELFYKEGTFYVYYTAKRKGDNVSCIGVATTTDIEKGFTDHGIIIEWGKEAIDGFVFQDRDKMYISWKAYGLTDGRPIEILASELSADGLSLIGEHFSLTNYAEGWQGEGDEGQCLIKHGDFYYLFYSVGGCCDNQCSYRVMVSRSKDLKTGWEQYPDPILQGNDSWKCSGHGTLVTTPDNRYFYLYHSYNATDFEYIGRQGMLDEVIWDKITGWPVFKNGSTPSIKASLPFKNSVQQRDSVLFDDFYPDESLKFWQWDLNKPKPEIDINNGQLVLSSHIDGIVFAGMSPKTGNYSFETEVAEQITDLAGICVYGNQENMLALAIRQSKLVIFQINDGEKIILTETAIPENCPVFLKVETLHGRFFHFFWSLDQISWVPVKVKNEYQLDGAFLPQWGVAMRTGIFLENQNTDRAKFSYVKLIYDFDSAE